MIWSVSTSARSSTLTSPEIGVTGSIIDHSRMSTKCPSMAAAAAIWGETRWVRPPRPWRPSKLRLEVEAQRSPGWRMSGFMPRHIEQPAVRQSNPAARKTSSRPSCSACRRTCWEPGTTIASTAEATRRPLTSSAAARRSPIREFVHEPMNTRSSVISCIGVPASRPMYFSARSSPSPRGSGTASVTGTTIPGVVPQVTSGESALASTSISLSKLAPSSVRRSRHAPRRSKSSGAAGRPSTHSNVVSSGAIIPARPPPSIVMLQIVIRPSIESPWIDRAGVLDDVAGRAVDAHLADRAEDQVLRRDAEAELAV